MNLSTLKPAEGAVKKNVKRLGRGQGSARGGTSGRGHKGAKSRSGYSAKVGFEGGQMPIQRRIPKTGFKNINRVEFEVLNLDRLTELVEKQNITDLNIETLRNLRVISKSDKIKVLGRGELKVKVNVEVNAISETAKKAIEEKGGSVKLV
jgi:large subunit ribosomal protein L15